MRLDSEQLPTTGDNKHICLESELRKNRLKHKNDLKYTIFVINDYYNPNSVGVPKMKD